MEVVPLGADKAVAARALLGRWGMHPEEMMAIGDGENDVEMLRLAGLSVAMDNGAQAAKDAAQFIGACAPAQPAQLRTC